MTAAQILFVFALPSCAPKSTSVAVGSPGIAVIVGAEKERSASIFLVDPWAHTQRELIGEDSDLGSSLSWSPSGLEILAIRYSRRARPQASQVISVDITRQDVRNVETSVSGAGVAKWSPDGAKLAVLADLNADLDTYRAIYVLGASSGETLGSYTANEAAVIDIAWSEEPSALIATGRIGGRTGMYLFDFGEDNRLLVKGFRDVPCVSLDVHNQRIACSMNRDPLLGEWRGERVIAVARGLNSEFVEVTGDNRVNEDAPSWSPDGSYLTFAESSESVAHESIRLVELETRESLHFRIKSKRLADLDSTHYYYSPVF